MTTKWAARSEADDQTLDEAEAEKRAERAKARKAELMQLPPDNIAHPFQKQATKLLVLIERVGSERRSINVGHALAGLKAAEGTYLAEDERQVNFAKDCKAIAAWFGGMAERADAQHDTEKD